MVYTGYVSSGLQNAEETGKLTADLFFYDSSFDMRIEYI